VFGSIRRLGSAHGWLWSKRCRYAGETVHSFTVTKGVKPSPAPPSPPTPPHPSPHPNPSPGPPTPPAGAGCCHYEDAKCKAGDTCCRSSCTNPSTCSYVPATSSLHGYVCFDLKQYAIRLLIYTSQSTCCFGLYFEISSCGSVARLWLFRFRCLDVSL
jgi:hypothetical protein